MDEGPRELEIETDPEMNLLQEIRKGHLKITSSNTEVAMVNGLGITPIKEGNATISVAYDDRVFDSIDIELLPGLSGHGWEENDPFLASEALARCKELEPKADDVKDCFIKGVITKVDTPFDAGYKNISFTIADSVDATEGLLVYRLATTAEEAEKLVRGCELKITGKLTHYQSSAGKSTFETKAGATVVEIIKEAEPEPPVTDHGYTQEDPFLASEALAKCKELAEGDVDLHPSFIKGVITKIDTPYDSGYKNISIVLADSEDAEEGLLIYRLKTNDEEAAKLIKGAEILITATLKHYVNSSGTSIYETNSGGTVIEIIKEAEPEPPVTAHGYVQEDPFKASEALEVAKALAAGASDENPAFIQGVITKVDTEFSSQYNNISFTIADKVDDEEGLLIYRLPCTEEQAAKLIVGAEVFVKATLKHYAPASGDPIYETNSGGVLLAINGEDPTPDPEVPVIDIIHSGTSIEDAYTADEAAQVMKNWEATETKVGEEEVFVSGKATKVSFNSKYSSYTIDLECQLGVFQLYSVGMDAEAGDYSANPNDLVGKIVTIKGYLEYFVKGEDIKFEVAYLSATLSPTGAAYTPQIVKVEGQEEPPSVEHGYDQTDPFLASEALAKCKELEAGKADEKVAYIKGVITKVDTAFNPTYNNISLVLADDVDAEEGLLLYRLSCTEEEAAKLIKGAEIFVSATLKHFVKNEQSIFETNAGGALIEITKEAEAPVEPEVRPDPVEASIAELNAMEGEIKDKTFLVTGVIEAMKNDKFGNAYLTDPVSGETIMLYGATTTETAIAYADGSFSWTNPKDAETTLEGIEDGMQVTMEVMFKLFNNTPEIFGIVKESSEFPFPYSVVVEENEDGVITPSKAAEVEYGEEITLEVEPAEGKKLKSLVVENAQGVKKDITEALKFNATCVNKVVATFEDAGAVLTQTLVDADKLGITGSYSDSAEAAKIDGADWMFKECMKSGTGAIQTRYKNSKASEVYNTTALAADVASVTFVFSADQTQTKDLLYVVAGAESVAEAGQSDANAMKLTWDGTEEGRTVTIEIPANLNARFLKLGHTTTSGAAYIQSVTINYRA